MENLEISNEDILLTTTEFVSLKTIESYVRSKRSMAASLQESVVNMLFKDHIETVGEEARQLLNDKAVDNQSNTNLQPTISSLGVNEESKSTSALMFGEERKVSNQDSTTPLMLTTQSHSINTDSSTEQTTGPSVKTTEQLVETNTATSTLKTSQAFSAETKLPPVTETNTLVTTNPILKIKTTTPPSNLSPSNSAQDTTQANLATQSSFDLSTQDGANSSTKLTSTQSSDILTSTETIELTDAPKVSLNTFQTSSTEKSLVTTANLIESREAALETNEAAQETDISEVLTTKSSSETKTSSLVSNIESTQTSTATPSVEGHMSIQDTTFPATSTILTQSTSQLLTSTEPSLHTNGKEMQTTNRIIIKALSASSEATRYSQNTQELIETSQTYEDTTDPFQETKHTFEEDIVPNKETTTPYIEEILPKQYENVPSLDNPTIANTVQIDIKRKVYDREKTLLYIGLFSNLQPGINYTLRISFKGVITNDLKGFYRTFYLNANGTKQ